MPSLAALDLLTSPRADPLSYPGKTLDFSYLWLDSWVYPLQSRVGFRLGQWRILVDGGPLAGKGGMSRTTADLNRALLNADSVDVNSRYPVLAFGSNAAPAQLLDKFHRLKPAQRVIPVTRASVMGFVLGHSPHISNPGYLPYVVVNGCGAADLDVFVLWLDSAQLSCSNETEPNYDLVPVPGDRYPLTLESAETISAYSAYKGKWGALQWLGEIRPARAGTQREVFTGLAAFEWFRALVGTGGVETRVLRLRDDRALRDKVRVAMADRGLATSDGWVAPLPGRSPGGA